jgi:hypothetical protein
VSVRPIVGVYSIAVIVASGCGGVSPAPAMMGETDASVAGSVSGGEADGGSDLQVDAGSSGLGGGPGVDAGAGGVVADAGIRPHDAGAFDSGRPFVDAGSFDSGRPFVDAGLVNEPLEFVEVLAGTPMAGRASPSVGLNQAAGFVISILRDAGVEPAFTQAPEPYLQWFGLMSPTLFQETHSHEDEAFGSSLFEHSTYREVWGRSAFAASDDVPNVVARIDGAGPLANEFVLLTAHLDHLGQTARGTYLGADDNASGSAVLLSAAKALQRLSQAGALNRSILLVWTGAEEEGLVGAAYFWDHLPPGLSRQNFIANVNMDMVGRWSADRISVIDTNRMGLTNAIAPQVALANQALAVPFVTINRDLAMYRNRHDGAVFMNDMPVLMIFEGLSRATGGGSLISEYHRTTDTVDLIRRDNGGLKLLRVRDLIVELARRLAN